MSSKNNESPSNSGDEKSKPAAKSASGLPSCPVAVWERIARIHGLINRDQHVTPERLAEEIGVSVRTIFRTTKIMEKRLQMPIKWDEDAETYCFTEPCPFLPSVCVEADENLVLKLVRHLMPAVAGWQAGDVLKRVLQKFGLMVGGKNSFVRETRPSVLVPSALPSAGEFQHLAVLNQAIEGNHYIRLNYRKSGATTPGTHTVWPLDIVYIKQRWLLVLMYPGRSERIWTFRLDRIHGVALTGKQFERPADLDVAARLRGNIGCYTGDEDHEVRILLSGFAAEDALTCPWHPSQEEIAREDGRLEIVLRLNNLIDVLYEVTHCGAQAEVVSPPALRERVQTEIKAMRAVYALGETVAEATCEKS